MVERSRVVSTDQGEFQIRVVPGASDAQGPNWISAIHGLDSDVYDGLVGSYDTAQAALQAALNKIGYVDHSGETPPVSMTALYDDGRGVVRIALRSQMVQGQRQHRATVTRQGSRLLLGSVFSDPGAAFDQALDWVLTDQSPTRQFGAADSDQNPSQAYKIRLDRDGDDSPSSRFTIIAPGGAELYTSDVVYRTTSDAIRNATHWIIRNT